MNLLNIDETHPGLRNKFENGTLTIDWSSRKISRNEVNVILEQTINANAAQNLSIFLLLLCLKIIAIVFAFGNLETTNSQVSKETHSKIKSFICTMYEQKQESCINTAR